MGLRGRRARAWPAASPGVLRAQPHPAQRLGPVPLCAGERPPSPRFVCGQGGPSPRRLCPSAGTGSGGARRGPPLRPLRCHSVGRGRRAGACRTGQPPLGALPAGAPGTAPRPGPRLRSAASILLQRREEGAGRAAPGLGAGRAAGPLLKACHEPLLVWVQFSVVCVVTSTGLSPDSRPIKRKRLLLWFFGFMGFFFNFSVCVYAFVDALGSSLTFFFPPELWFF